MPSYRTDRTAEDMKRHLSEIFRELKDPRISMLLSVIRVEVSGDLSYAKVFVSAIEGAAKTAESVKGLNNAKGYIKRELSSRVKLRKMPDLKFIADDSIAHGAEIARIIEDFDMPKKEEENED
ncbi:MAG: 30S ribosome-binding factor RbfA [Clostridia bacterium]|nr:30S ribosome-binding factor RbfA [Clostridia bacterium]